GNSNLRFEVGTIILSLLHYLDSLFLSSDFTTLSGGPNFGEHYSFNFSGKGGLSLCFQPLIQSVD
ncbi:MAG: hypothetical protein WBV94_13170, partial [Blastocatellia bacterium]